MAPKPDHPGKMDPNAPEGVQALWKQFVAIHQAATPKNTEETGKKIWALTNSDFHGHVGTAIGEMLRTIQWDKVGVKLESLTYRILGTIAAEHANEIVGADLEITMRNRDDGTVTAEIEGHYNGNLTPYFEAREDDGEWKFMEGSAFFASRKDGVHSNEDGPKPPTSKEALAEAWTKLINSGTGEQMWGLVSSGTRSSLQSSPNKIEGFNNTAIILVLDAALEARRAKKITITKSEIDGREITFTYSDGSTETREADSFGDDVWQLNMMNY